MPIYSAQKVQLIALNKDKSRGVSLDFPPDMKLGELLDKINEIRAQVIKAIEEDVKKEKESAEKKDDKIEEVKAEIIKPKK